MNNQTQPFTKRDWAGLTDEQRQALLCDPYIRREYDTILVAESALAGAWVRFGLAAGQALSECAPVAAPMAVPVGASGPKVIERSAGDSKLAGDVLFSLLNRLIK